MMIEKDRILLNRMAMVTNLGAVLVWMMRGQEFGRWDTADLRGIGNGLSQLGTDMAARADEIDRCPHTVAAAEDQDALESVVRCLNCAEPVGMFYHSGDGVSGVL